MGPLDIGEVIVLFFSILTYLAYVWTNGFYDILTLVIRLVGLVLYQFINADAAYLINTSVIDAVDSNFYKGKLTAKPNIQHRAPYEMQDKICDNINRFAYVMSRYTRAGVGKGDIGLSALYIFRSIGEIIYGWSQIISPAKGTEREQIFIPFANYFQVKVLTDIILGDSASSSLRTSAYALGALVKVALEYKMHSPRFLTEYDGR